MELLFASKCIRSSVTVQFGAPCLFLVHRLFTIIVLFGAAHYIEGYIYMSLR